VHHPDALVIDAGDPLAPEVWQVALEDNPEEYAGESPPHEVRRDEWNRLIPGNRLPGELTEHVSAPSSRPTVRQLDSLAAALCHAWSLSRRQVPGGNLIEQARRDGPIGIRGDVRRLRQQGAVAG